MKRETIVILDNIRSVYNVGSIFRTADALGINELILTGTTPTPTDRFGRPRADLAKVALGAEKSVKWKYVSKTEMALKKQKAEGFQIVAIEQAKRSQDYKKVKIKNKVSFLLGEETKGLNSEILKKADIIAEIPMRGEMVRQAHHPKSTRVGKESLNVSVAFGVALFRLLKQ